MHDIQTQEAMAKGIWANWQAFTVPTPFTKNLRRLPNAVYLENGKYKLHNWASLLLLTFDLTIDGIDEKEHKRKVTIEEAISTIENVGQVVETHHFKLAIEVRAADNQTDVAIYFKSNPLREKFKRLATQPTAEV